MCGIIGMTGRHEEAVRTAARRLAYRGPDASGVWADERVTLGHNRLSIIDLDARSNQPFFDESGEIGIVFNGEIYNFKELRAELERAGHAFRTSSDTEVLVHAYLQWGESMVARLRGMFAFALYDRRAGKVVLASDVSSIKPLYYAHRQGEFAFASEIKGVLALSDNKEIDSEAVELYFAHGYVPSPHTLYKGVRRLPPRTIVVYDCMASTIEEHTYVLDDTAAPGEESVRQELAQSVQAHLIADVPVGLFFSGGTDSSLLAALLKDHGTPLTAFSVKVEGRDTDAPYFDAIAKELKLDAHVLQFDQQAFDRAYSEVMGLLDEPLADNSLLPTYAVSRFAAGQVKVVLSGEGGDEFFYGYPRSMVLNRMGSATRWGWPERLYAILPNFKGKGSLFSRLFVILGRPLSYYLLEMSPARGLLTGAAWRHAWEGRAHEAVEPTSYDAAWYLPNDLLRKTDLATMYASIEGRVPLVDRRVIAAARAQSAPAANETEAKPLLKRILSSYLPAKLVYRPKSGFGLELGRFLEHSASARADLAKAMALLGERKLLPLRYAPTERELLRRYPNLAWALIVLMRVIQNNEAL